MVIHRPQKKDDSTVRRGFPPGSLTTKRSRFWCIAVSATIVLGASAGTAAAQSHRDRPATKVGVTRPATHVVRAAQHATTDCNANGIPDQTEIENCPGLPACDDCNLNELPDECDLTAGISLDVDLNGVPDECVFYDGGGLDDGWGTGANWDTDQSPDDRNQSDDVNATVGLTNVLLDVDVEVGSLRLLDGAALDLAGLLTEDLLVEESGGVEIRSSSPLQSHLRARDGRTIDASQGKVHIGSGGVYEGLVVPAGTGTAASSALAGGQLLAGLVLIDSRCGEPIAGEMNLTGTMSAHVLGNVAVDASRDCVVCAACPMAGAAGVGAIAGGETPPILRVRQASTLLIDGDLLLLGPAALLHTSSQPITLQGSFINESPCPECFNATGPLILGATTGGSGLPQFFEVAGRDLGPTPAGFVGNFSHGTIDVSSHADVRFQNVFPNVAPGAKEAIYVDTLILRSGSMVTIIDCGLYYNQLVNEGGTINFVAGGTLQQVFTIPSIPTVSTWGLTEFTGLLLIAGVSVLRRRRRCPNAV